MKQNDLNEKKYKYKKATRRPLFYEERRIYLYFWGLSCWESGAFFLYSFVELGGYENHSVVLDTLDIKPFLWLETAFNGDHCSLSEVVSFLLHASMFMKAEVRLSSSPFFSVRLIASEKRIRLR